MSPAKFKWLGPSPAPQMGSVSAGLPAFARAVIATSLLCRQCRRRESVFYMHNQAGTQETKKKTKKTKACRDVYMQMVARRGVY